MRDSKLGYWLQLFANIGILAGLIVVGFQMQQDRNLAAANLKSDSFRITYELQLAAMGEDPADSVTRLITAPETITPKDLMVIDAYMNAHLWIAFRNDSLEQAGLYDSEWTDRVIPDMAMNFGGNPYMRHRALSFTHPAPWIQELKSQIREVDPNFGIDLVNEKLERLKSAKAVTTINHDEDDKP